MKNGNVDVAVEEREVKLKNEMYKFYFPSHSLPHFIMISMKNHQFICDIGKAVVLLRINCCDKQAYVE
jgi:hypothetical protein